MPGGRYKKMISKSRSSASVKNIGLPSAISNQILKKYGSQKKIKNVHSVNLIVPAQGIKYFEETNSIWISCLKLHMENLIPVEFVGINQAEIDDEYISFSVDVVEKPEMIPQQFIGVDRNTTGHIVVAANPDTGFVRMMGKKALHIHTKYKNIRTRLQKTGMYRKVKRMQDRESRIVRDLNHKVSKELVRMAKSQNAALVFEDLSGIRKTKKQNPDFKYFLHSWSFYQLQQFIEYKAKLLWSTCIIRRSGIYLARLLPVWSKRYTAGKNVPLPEMRARTSCRHKCSIQHSIASERYDGSYTDNDVYDGSTDTPQRRSSRMREPLRTPRIYPWEYVRDLFGEIGILIASSDDHNRQKAHGL